MILAIHLTLKCSKHMKCPHMIAHKMSALSAGGVKRSATEGGGADEVVYAIRGGAGDESAGSDIAGHEWGD